MIRPPSKSFRRQPIRFSSFSVLVFQIEVSWTSSLVSTFAKNGARLLPLTIPLDECSNSAFVGQELSKVLGEADAIDLALCFADFPGASLEIGGDLPAVQQAFDTNVYSLKLLIDHLFTKLKRVSQISVLLRSSEPKRPVPAPYKLARSAIEMMVQLYGAERPTTHFSVIAAPYDGGIIAEEYVGGVVATLNEVVNMPSGTMVDLGAENRTASRP